MADMSINRVSSTGDRTLPVFGEADRLLDEIRLRAFSLFARRGFREGGALEDWLAAEREVCWPNAELAEREKDFIIDVAIPGFEAGEIDMTVTPRELIIHARKSVESNDERKGQHSLRRREVYRRIDLPEDVDVKNVTSTLKDGMLSVTAPKLTAAPVRAAVTIPAAATTPKEPAAR